MRPDPCEANEGPGSRRILEHRMADLLGPEATSAAFLTEGPQAEEAEDTEEAAGLCGVTGGRN